MLGHCDPEKDLIQLPCEMDVTTDISPSKIRSALCKINIPKSGAMIRASQVDIDRWSSEGIVVRSVTVNGRAPDGVLLGTRGPVMMAGIEMVPDAAVPRGKLIVMAKG